MTVLKPGLIACALSCAVLLAGCKRQPAQADAAPVPAVRTLVVRSEAASAGRTLSGVLLVAEETRLSFPVGGKLAEVPLREGEEFTAGQLIARLDPVDLERDLATRRAQLAAHGRPHEGSIRRDASARANPLNGRRAIAEGVCRVFGRCSCW